MGPAIAKGCTPLFYSPHRNCCGTKDVQRKPLLSQFKQTSTAIDRWNTVCEIQQKQTKQFYHAQLNWAKRPHSQLTEHATTINNKESTQM